MRRPRRNLILPCLVLAAGSGVFVLAGASRDREGAGMEAMLAEAAGRPVGAGAEVIRTASGQEVVFGRDVRPILSDRCFKCHGFDSATRAAGLRLDQFEDATHARDGGAAIVPGEVGKSEVWNRITSANASLVMPPPDSGKKPLSEAEREIIRAWIESGAKYEKHWAFETPVRPAEPMVKNGGWTKNAVDRFVLAKLEARGVAPSPEADAATLARRVFLELTGLPPTPEELDAFLTDTAPDAYERLVDKLLTQEPYITRYAERMAAPWMDQARYADTNGIHMDAGRQMWLWRDWVLEAYRSNMPYDRFVTEQLAGDLIPGATVEQKVASGFNRNHVTTDEGGAIAEEYLVEYAVDRTSTVGSVMLGLTVGCARCHDHKFDPVTAEDFFSLYAFFNSIEEPGLYSQEADPKRAFEPFIVVPTAAQKSKIAELIEEAKKLRESISERTPEEESQYRAFLSEVASKSGVEWVAPQVEQARADNGVTLTAAADRSITASGPNAPMVTYSVDLATQKVGLRLLSLEALLAENGKVGRAPNGNAVVSQVKAEVTSLADPSKKQNVRFVWAWADHSQQNGDYDVVNIIDGGRPANAGWALEGHDKPGARVALLLSEEPFGFEGGSRVTVTIEQTSTYTEHTLAKVRLDLGTINESGIARLPVAKSRWYYAGSFPGDKENRVYEPALGPEMATEGVAPDALAFGKTWGPKNELRWAFDITFNDGMIRNTPAGRLAEYFGRYVYAPTARTLDVTLGSDDAWKIYVNTKEAAARFVERGIDQGRDNATIEVKPGRNAVVLKIANTGGPGGAFWTATDRPGSADALTSDMTAAILSETARSPELAARLDRAWRETSLPAYRERAARLDAIDAEKKALDAAAPKTMVMKELPKPRETFVLSRGAYDQPDKNRPVSRRVPAFLGKLPEGAPADRLGLSKWMTGAENPLFARVTVNRMWEMVFGKGLVRTTDDFGLQGDWPSHPELLDWLAVEFRESGWNVRHVLRLMVTSATYKQASIVRKDVAETDPENRLLAFYPRRRLGAEQIRDMALFNAGLLAEKMGGPSVKPYQPEGIWTEVAMPQSNTRIFERGMGEDLYRRSLYTYWKRAAPSPSMLTFDAPTREMCTVGRPSTNTPLQALVLWNDEQFVEAARVLAQRTLTTPGDDASRLTTMFRRWTARMPSEREMAAIAAALADFRKRYADAPADAEALLKVGVAEKPKDLAAAELAAWTMLASSMMNLHEAITQD
jgi:hypothetical protein